MTTNSSSLGGLPAELLLRVTESLTLNDRCSLSAVNSQFRKFLTPALFGTVIVKSDNCPAEALSTFCRKFGRYVEKLRFECHLHPNTEEDEDEIDSNKGSGNAGEEANDAAQGHSEPSSGRLSQQLQDLLSGQMLPKMASLEVLFLPENNFGYEEDWDDGQQDLGSIYIHEEPEVYNTVVSKEATYSWRLMMNQVFTSTAANKSIKRLELIDLLPKACSVFRSELWTEFLNGLHEVKIELWGSDNGAGWHSNTTAGYRPFVDDLGSIFFDNLTSIKRLEFIPDSENPVGCEGMNHSPIPFQSESMGEIKHLDLWNCFIDPPLLEFLTTKSQQLKSVRLMECFSAGEDFGLAENGIPWSKFLAKWREANPVMEEFSVFNSKVPLTSDEQFSRDPPEQEEPDEVKAVRETLGVDRHRRLFAYVHLDDKYGMVFCNEEANVEYFEKGDDQREYDALLGHVARNRETQGLSPKWSKPTLEYAASMMERQRLRQERYND